MLVDEARKHMGIKGGTVEHAKMVDYYNAASGKPRGYTLKYNDNWCMALMTVCALQSGLTAENFPVECGCEMARRKAETLTSCKVRSPYDRGVCVNDLVMFGKESWVNHVGVVSRVDRNTAWTIEGNNLNQVREVRHTFDDFICVIHLSGQNNISSGKKSNEEIAREVMSGLWGNGTARRSALEAAGYNYSEIQHIVNGWCSSNPPYDLTAIATECMLGKWGNGAERRQRLETAGFVYADVQAIVNKLVKERG